jgi:predicted ArsR family transcriptional regulator
MPDRIAEPRRLQLKRTMAPFSYCWCAKFTTVNVPTRPHDALAQDTRARLFSLLGELRRPASTEELADTLGLHPSGVRVHLERLRDAGLVTRERERRPRGRPRDTWAISPDAQLGGDPPSAYRDLGRWLVRALANAKAPVRTAEATGRQIGRELASADGEAPPEQRFRSALVALGFQPHGEVVAEVRLTYRLGNCPYRDAVAERP